MDLVNSQTKGEWFMPKIQSNDVNLYYEMNGDGQSLLFIHGLGLSTRDWEFQVPEFSKAYRVVTFDLRGHGRSDKPPGPYSIPLFASDTAGLVKALGIESAHVVGWSLGGGIAFQLAIDLPALVKTMVIVNFGPVGFRNTPEDKQVLDQRVETVRQHGMRAMGETLSLPLFPDAELVSLRSAFVERYAENDPRAFIDANLAMVDWNVTDKIRSIQCPTLIVAADQDFTPVVEKEAYVKLMPHAQLVVISDTRHATPLERPQKFNAALMEFLSRVSST
jgi:3-oxoadipate enol-lactonase